MPKIKHDNFFLVIVLRKVFQASGSIFHCFYAFANQSLYEWLMGLSTLSYPGAYPAKQIRGQLTTFYVRFSSFMLKSVLCLP